MHELEGLELASFTSRAVALFIDFVIAGALFLSLLLEFFKIANRYTSLGQNNQHINVELNFLENWYSIVYLVIFFGLSLYFGNGRTIGKRVMVHSEPPDGSRPHGGNDRDPRQTPLISRSIFRPVRRAPTWRCAMPDPASGSRSRRIAGR